MSLCYLVINEPNQQTSVCRVDISPNRGSNVPCSNDVSSVLAYNANGYSSVATTNFGVICSISCEYYLLYTDYILIYWLSANSSTLNSSLSLDSDTLIVQVYLLALSQSSSSFALTLSNLTPSGQTALASLTSTFNGSSTSSFGNVNKKFQSFSQSHFLLLYVDIISKYNKCN